MKNSYYLLLLIFLFLSSPLFSQEEGSGISLDNPVKYEAYYDFRTGNYVLYPKVGGVVVGTPVTMTSDEYTTHVMRERINTYYRDKFDVLGEAIKASKAGSTTGDKTLIPSITVKSKIFEKIFGGNKIELKPTGYASFDLGILHQKIDNPQILPQNRQSFTIDLRQRIQLGLQGSVGRNVQLGVNYDTQAGFAFENKLNLAFIPGGTLPNGASGDEDNIIKKIEFGNVSMPLSTSLITGAQSLFGVKGEFQFGKTSLAVVFSEQQSEARNITVQGGGVVNTFNLRIPDYEDNQHYFLAHYFGNSYDESLLNYPLKNSTVNINKIEIWVVDRGNSNLQEQRPVLALRDLGENSTKELPQNSTQGIYSTILTELNGNRNESEVKALIEGKVLPDYEGNIVVYMDGENFTLHRRVKKLSTSEYTLDPKLGYISLNQKLNNDQLLAVAFEYTDSKQPGKVFKVGEFSNEVTGTLIVKLLKPNQTIKTISPMWKLMMKNIYSLEASQINSEDFMLNVLYQDASEGKVNYIPDPAVRDQQLIQLLNWDRLDQNNNLVNTGKGNGIFDFLEGVTINSNTGKLIFTKTQPFGSYLSSKGVGAKYVFNTLYNNVKGSTKITSDPLYEKYSIEGRFKGTTGSGISLGAFNIPQGSVKVTANGQTLTEGVDYIVDYQMGSVTIINETYKSSGVPINISMENQFAFNMQKKRFMGVNVEHKFSEDLIVGATFLNYKERPLTQKVLSGYEPVNNSIVGINLMWNQQMPFFTKLANWIPGVKTDAESNLSLKVEGAALLPGENKTIDNQSYIDDFETTASKISLKDPGYWKLASNPNAISNDLASGYNRALMSWYFIDTRFFGIGGSQPSGINKDALSKHLQRRVQYKELFNKQYLSGEELYMNTFDVSFYPTEKGPYNFDSNFSIGSSSDNWGGLMRPLNVTNFIESNIEYLEFWMMDPYADGAASLGTDPELIIHLGNVSEDVLKDGQMLYENGITDNKTELVSTIWGYSPKNYPLVYAFDTEGEARIRQDIGYDGLHSNEEAGFFGVPNWINPISGQADPAGDDFVFFLHGGWDSSSFKSSIIDRYKYFRNPEGNSPSNSLDAATSIPDTEDLNGDYNLDETENYNSYELKLGQTDLVTGNKYIADIKTVDVTLPNRKREKTKWVLVRIPVAEGGSTDILNNVRYIRMLMKGFSQTTTLRFATLDLVRSDWRKYEKLIANSLNNNSGNEGINDQLDLENIVLSEVNLEENASSKPPYVLPPGVDQEILGGTIGSQKQNESSLQVEVKKLNNTEARGVYKKVYLDMRRYSKLEMFVSAQNRTNKSSSIVDDKTKFFIRLGSDLSENYYEYEIPLQYTSESAIISQDIWPVNNMIDLALQDLVSAKKEKDNALGYNSTERYKSSVTGNVNKIIYVKGRPSIGNINSMMMGVRRSDATEIDLTLWLNELRLTGIENEAGYAATASLSFNLADFAQVDVGGAYQSVGFGALDSKPMERSQDETKQYSINAAINVDKVMPEEWGVKIPLTVSYSETFIDPKYNPLDTDVELKNDPRKNQLKKIVNTYSAQKSIGVTNLRKERTGGKKTRFYDVENFSASFMYSDDYYRDIYTTHEIRKDIQAVLNYNFTARGRYYEPFKKWGAVQDSSRFARYLRPIKEFNFNPVPSRLSFRADVNRTYNQFEYRDVNAYLNGTPSSYTPAYSHNFLFGWQYNIGFNLTRSLKLDYTSSTQNVVDGMGYNRPNEQMIWNDLLNSGAPNRYNQKLQVNYKLPIHYFPYMDFSSLEVGYTSQYDWESNSIYDGNESLGHDVQNTQTFTLIGNADFLKLYSNFGTYNKFEEKRNNRQREIDSLNQSYETNFVRKNPRPFRKYNFKNKYKSSDYLWMFLSSIKRGQVQINENKGTWMPGFMATPSFFGMGSYYGSSSGPTLGFLFGSQSDLRDKAFREGWVTKNALMTDPYIKNTNSQITANLQLEPINQLMIDLDVARSHLKTISQSGYNLADPNNSSLRANTFETYTATFNSTIISISTSFQSGDKIYSQMLENSKVISERVALAQGKPIIKDANGYVEGFGLTHQEVLLPSFVSAFTGKNASSQKLGYKRGIPIPNWRISYGGLKNIPWVNYWFQDLRINHSYVSNYGVSGVGSNSNYASTDLGDRDSNDNYHNRYNYGTVAMVEGFSPLIGIDATLRNNIQVSIAYNKDRTYTLGLTNYTLQEEEGNEFSVGIGYIVKDLKMKLRYRGSYKNIRGDLNIRGDVTFRDSKITVRRLVELDSQVAGGQDLLAIKFSADYNFTQKFNLKLFYEQQVSKYKVSTAYPLSTVRAGLSATFKLN